MYITFDYVRSFNLRVYKRDPSASAPWDIPRDVDTRARKPWLCSLHLNWDRARTVKTATIARHYDGGNTLESGFKSKAPT